MMLHLNQFDFESQKIAARDSLREMLGTTSEPDEVRRSVAQQSIWAERLYQRFRDDAQTSNDRVYQTSKLYTPLSVTPFLALVIASDQPRVLEVVLMALASIGLMLMANVSAAREHLYRDYYNAWAFGIQEEIGFDTGRMGRPLRLRSFHVRMGFLVSLTLVWLAAILATALGVST